MSPRLPAVVPGAGVGEDARFAGGRGGCGEVGGRGEPFVREAEDAGGEGAVYEVWRVIS